MHYLGGFRNFRFRYWCLFNSYQYSFIALVPSLGSSCVCTDFIYILALLHLIPLNSETRRTQWILEHQKSTPQKSYQKFRNPRTTFHIIMVTMFALHLHNSWQPMRRPAFEVINLSETKSAQCLKLRKWERIMNTLCLDKFSYLIYKHYTALHF